jgi:hypothetical protein
MLLINRDNTLLFHGWIRNLIVVHIAKVISGILKIKVCPIIRVLTRIQ